MIELYAYDFDKTLIPYDSFRRYLWYLCKYKPITVLSLILLRKLRLLSSCSLKHRITRLVESSSYLTLKTKLFSEELKKDIEWPENKGITLIITASPLVYMKYVVENSTYQLLCSDTIDNQYVEMYGETKAEYLQSQFPQIEHQYMFACSDSTSDICWMKYFHNYKLIK